MLTATLETASIVFRAFVPRNEDVWGDGFVHDGFADLVAVREWGDVNCDQYVRVYPRLLGQRSADLTAHVACALSDLRVHAQPPEELRSPARDWPPKLERTRAPGPPLAYLRSLEPQDLVCLEAFVDAVQSGAVPGYDPEIAERVAFLAAVHPAYFWPEALVSHQLFTSLGWLGIFMRGRPAFMLYDVAEFLAETITVEEKGGLRVHPAIEKRIGSGSAALALRSDAKQRLDGLLHVNRFRQVRTSRSRAMPRGAQ